MCVLLFGSFLRGPRRRGPVAPVGRAGTVPVGTVRVCAPRLMWRGRWSWSARRTGPGGSVARGCSGRVWTAGTPAERSAADTAAMLRRQVRARESGTAERRIRAACGACDRPFAVTSRGDDATRPPGSTTTRSKRSGSRGSSSPSGASRGRAGRTRPPGRAPACGGRPSPRAARSRASPRQRTSTITSAAGGPGSTATRSISWRPTWTFRARTVQPASDEPARASVSAASPACCAGVRPDRRICRPCTDGRSAALTGHVSEPPRRVGAADRVDRRASSGRGPARRASRRRPSRAAARGRGDRGSRATPGRQGGPARAGRRQASAGGQGTTGDGTAVSPSSRIAIRCSSVA